MNRAAISRADLIRCAATLDDDCLGHLADSLGYKKQSAAQAVGRKGGALIEPPASVVRAEAHVPTSVGERRPHHQYRIVERRQLAPRPTTPAPQPIPEPAPRVVPLRQAPPLIPWPRLWPFLRTALGIQAERHRIDLRRVVTTAARLQPLRRLPRVKGLHWAPRGQLVLDLSRRLYPFWNDFHAIRDQIECLRGASGLEVLRLDRGPDGPVQPWEGEVQGWGAPRPYRLPPAGAPVLIAGDLGCLGPAAETRSWVQLGRRLAAHGCRAVVLTPCPPRWWAPALAGLYFPVTLERTAHLPPVPAGPLPWPTSAPDLAAERERDAGARRLLTLLSPCIAITPPLIRHLRYLLPAGLADVGSEAIAWQHPAFIGGDHPLVPGDQAKLTTLRHAFPTTGTVQQRRLAWELILAQQVSMDSSVAVRLEERAL